MNLRTLTSEEFLNDLSLGRLDFTKYDYKELAEKIEACLDERFQEGYDEGYKDGEKDQEEYGNEVSQKLQRQIDDLEDANKNLSADVLDLEKEVWNLNHEADYFKEQVVENRRSKTF